MYLIFDSDGINKRLATVRPHQPTLHKPTKLYPFIQIRSVELSAKAHNAGVDRARGILWFSCEYLFARSGLMNG